VIFIYMRHWYLFIFIIFSNYCIAAKRVDLMQSFNDAARNDPTYQIEVALYKERLQSLPESTSAVLPQVTLNADALNESSSTSLLPGGSFNTRSFNLDATQTIFNYTQFKEIARSSYVVKSAFASVCGAQQDLMFRTVQAYFDVLRTRQFLEFTKQQKQYLKMQVKATQTLFNHNDASITDLEQAKGAYDLIRSQLYTAEIDAYNAVQALSQITGVIYEEFAEIKSNFPLINPVPKQLNVWLKTANQQNLFLRAARFDINESQEALSARTGDFFPNFSGIGGISRAVEPNPLLTDTQSRKFNYIGINANWNVFQGGLTIAQVKAASARVQQTTANMRREYLKVMADTRRAYNGIVQGKERVKRIRSSLTSNTRALKSAQEAYQAGVLTITEILQIQGQLYRAQADYTDNIYNYIIDLVRLKQAAGTLDIESLCALNKWLTPHKACKCQKVCT